MRPDWDEYFFGIAEAVATRASCPRASVGAVIVSADNRILSTGYNGAPPGEPHCFDEGCEVVDGHCQRALHAEVNAVAWAARAGVSLAGARLYNWSTKRSPRKVCRECAKVLRAVGITDIRCRQTDGGKAEGMAENISGGGQRFDTVKDFRHELRGPDPVVTRLFPRGEVDGRYLEDVAIFAARRCRTTKEHHELWGEVLSFSDEKRANFLGKVVNEEWAIDILEMLHLVYDFENIPLWLVVEMLRHRLLFRDFSLEQLSQRAIDPMKLQVQAPTPETQSLVHEYMEQLKGLLAAGRIPPENLREVVPQGVLVNFTMAGNARAWHHNFFMRCSPALGGKGGAHPKFMRIADAALEQAQAVYPLAFKEVIPA